MSMELRSPKGSSRDRHPMKLHHQDEKTPRLSSKRQHLKSMWARFFSSTQAFAFDPARMIQDRLARLIRQIRPCSFFFVSWCLGGETSGLIRGSGVCLLLFCSLKMTAAEAPSYRGLMRIPIDLVTSDGTRLEKAQYQIEVKLEAGGYVLAFSSEGHVKAIVKSVPDSDLALASASVPVVGTHYLRPSTDPIPAGEERRFSKTGKAQYEEETRDWKATLRVYKAPPDAVFFIFQTRGARRQWDHVSFKFSIVPK